MQTENTKLCRYPGIKKNHFKSWHTGKRQFIFSSFILKMLLCVFVYVSTYSQYQFRHMYGVFVCVCVCRDYDMHFFLRFRCFNCVVLQLMILIYLNKFYVGEYLDCFFRIIICQTASWMNYIFYHFYVTCEFLSKKMFYQV